MWEIQGDLEAALWSRNLGAGLLSPLPPFNGCPSSFPPPAPWLCLLLGVMSETLIMSDYDTDSPDIHNKETRRREGKRDLGGEGKVRRSSGDTSLSLSFFFPSWPIKISRFRITSVWLYDVQGKLSRSKVNAVGDSPRPRKISCSRFLLSEDFMMEPLLKWLWRWFLLPEKKRKGFIFPPSLAPVSFFETKQSEAQISAGNACSFDL